jgi:hypothetical protein
MGPTGGMLAGWAGHHHTSPSSSTANCPPVPTSLCSPLCHPPACRQQLPEVLKASSYDWVAITSPEAAAVLLEAWEQAGKPKVAGQHGAQEGGGSKP